MHSENVDMPFHLLCDHLDVLGDLLPKSFIKCSKRFTSRRGVPLRIISDNGTTFKAANKIIMEIFQSPAVQQQMRIKWSFNIERAPWWGGLFERMIKSTKSCLRKMIGRAKLTYEELQTAVIEVEAVLNSRPLSYLTASDTEEPLTPSHLLTGRRILSLPDHLCYEEENEYRIKGNQVILDKQMKYLEAVLQQFWNRWKREYLLELRESHRAGSSQLQKVAIAVGDVVIIHTEDLPRSLWKMGRVEELIRGKDGVVRGASIRVQAKETRSKLLRRPIQKLYPVELANGMQSSSSNGMQSLSSNGMQSSVCSRRRPMGMQSSSSNGMQSSSSNGMQSSSSNGMQSSSSNGMQSASSNGTQSSSSNGMQSSSSNGMQSSKDRQSLSSSTQSSPQNQKEGRPRRVAAREAQDRIFAQSLRNM